MYILIYVCRHLKKKVHDEVKMVILVLADAYEIYREGEPKSSIRWPWLVSSNTVRDARWSPSPRGKWLHYCFYARLLLSGQGMVRPGGKQAKCSGLWAYRPVNVLARLLAFVTYYTRMLQSNDLCTYLRTFPRVREPFQD